MLLLTPHLGGGGAEKVIETLATHLNREKYEVHLGLVTQSTYEPGAFNPAITVHSMAAQRVRYSAFRVLCLVWRIRPALILSSSAHLNALALVLHPILPGSTRIIVRQSCELSLTFADGGHPRLSRSFYRLMYAWADRIICQSAAMAHELRDRLQIPAERLATLLNPVDVDTLRTATFTENAWIGPGPYLLAIGRLVPEKGFDLLLKALAAVKEQFPHAELVILGAGQCETSLKELRSQLRLQTAVHFPGHVAFPEAYFHRASLFVLSSRSEGIPNALLEAAAAGLPIVATPASPGVSALLGDKPGIWLTREISANALQHALCEALSALSEGQRFPHGWIESYSLARAIPAYERLIDEVLGERVH